ncbi:cupin [Siphonobacter sp. BAB-5385]|uniref:cupin domain-containing protein n=1 Tax=Siphonobacter sp. BAB-5385 TaxID=1864822 RepID=UPI000B9E7110|nr:cupin domain-containing protein [Siphonobacter sp. BAB-5385]OZI08438.1 cupin [Siphonobacter sp. BAB-5385]
MKPERLHFKDDGVIPNNALPLLIYSAVFKAGEKDLARRFETLFSEHRWRNSWRNGVYPYHHYHSISHEVLGVYSGQATLQMGGEKGQSIHVQAGDVLVIPAGVGHKKLEASSDFGVVGEYPEGKDWDLLKGEKGDRPQADRNIAAVPMPSQDPVTGAKEMPEWHT